MYGGMSRERNFEDRISLRWVECNIPQKVKLVPHLTPTGVGSNILVWICLGSLTW